MSDRRVIGMSLAGRLASLGPIPNKGNHIRIRTKESSETGMRFP